MKQGLFEIAENRRLAENAYRMVLLGDTGAITRPGQFVNIRLEGFFLRRPISVCDCEKNRLTIIYKTVGKGTELMSSMKAGALDILTGLGNGYDLEGIGERPVLIGGGAGVPPMYWLCRELIKKGRSVNVIIGFNTAREVFYEKEFDELGAKTTVTTADGSHGVKGFVTDALKNMTYTDFCACGPEPMLRAVYSVSETTGQLSFEERMGCGFGACMGCSCRTVTGYKRICREGPVLRKEEILWNV